MDFFSWVGEILWVVIDKLMKVLDIAIINDEPCLKSWDSSYKIKARIPRVKYLTQPLPSEIV